MSRQLKRFKQKQAKTTAGGLEKKGWNSYEKGKQMLIFAHFKWKLFRFRWMEIAGWIFTQCRRQLWCFTV